MKENSKRKQKREERVTEYANELMRRKERKKGRELTPEEINEAFRRADRRENIKRRLAKILAVFGITVTIGGVALLNSGKEPEPEHPSGQETDIDNEKDNEKPKTNREKWLEGIQEEVGENPNQTKQDIENTIDEILEQYNANLLEQAQIDKDDLGIILRENMGEGHVIEVTSANGEISYVENPLITGQLPEGEEWVEAKDIKDEYILVDTENNNTITGIGTINSEITEIDVQYASFGGKEYVKNDQTYVGLPEAVDLEKAYKDFSDYYQFRVQQQEEQQRNDAGFEH